jgi:hypothetical protein
MPQVPAPVPTVSVADTPLPKVSVNSPEAAFGGATAAAITNLGHVVEGAGNELFNRAIALQNINNEAEAKEADTKYMIESGKLHAEYNALQGDEAVKAYPKYQEALEKTRTDIRGSISNPAAAKLYDSSSKSTMGRNIFNGAGVAASAQRQYVSQASTARVQSLMDQTIQSPDEKTFRSSLQSVETEIRGTQAQLAGWSPEKTEEEVARAKSQLITNRVQGMARVDPWGAKEFLEKSRGGLIATDVNKADQYVQIATHGAGAKLISAEVNEDLKSDPLGAGKTLQERIDEGVEKAKKLAPDDPLMADYARQRIISDWNLSRSVKKDFDLNNKNTISKALMGQYDPQGKLPTTVEELTAHPEARAAWEQMDAKDQRSYLNVLSKNAKGDQSWTNESLRRNLQLKGLAQADPKAFMEIDVLNENLPNSAKLSLVNQQLALKNKAESDPRVTHAMQVLRPMTQAAGLDPTRDKDQFYQFVGSLQDAMDQYQKDNKKLPNADEINKIGARLLQQQPGSGYFGTSLGAEPLYRISVPEKEATRIKSDPFWVGRGVTPTDSDVQRIYAREQYQKLYGGAKKTEGPQAPKL